MKKGLKIFLLIFLIIVLLVLTSIGFLIYSALKTPDNLKLYLDENKQPPKNPVAEISSEQAIENFNETYVWYLLYSLEAYNLHAPAFSSSNLPKIEIRLEDSTYNSIINKGQIIVDSRAIEGEDAVIISTKQELISMIRDKNYVEESFRNGKSSIELVAGKTELFEKGYLALYTKITGKSITGSAIKIFAD